jgi:hypothetical protein
MDREQKTDPMIQDDSESKPGPGGHGGHGLAPTDRSKSCASVKGRLKKAQILRVGVRLLDTSSRAEAGARYSTRCEVTGFWNDPLEQA